MRSTMLIGLAATLLLLAVISHSTAQEKRDIKQLNSALVVAFEKEKVFKIHRLTNEKQLMALETYFPNYRNRPDARRAGAWIPDYEVYFNFDSGETIRLEVTLARTPQVWRVFGRGDHDLKGDFGKFADGLKPGGAWTGGR